MNQLYLSFIIVDLFTSACALIILLHLKSKIAPAQEVLILRSMLFIYIFMNLTDSLNALQEGRLVAMGNRLYAFTVMLSMLPVILGCYFLFRFINIRLYPARHFPRKLRVLSMLPALILCLLNILSSFTGWIFFISADGKFSYGPLFFVQIIITQAYIGIAVLESAFEAVRTASPEKRNEYYGYIACMGIAIAASFLEDFFPGIPLLSLCIFLVIQILFQTIYLDQQQKLAAEEKELTDSRISIMLSQIQPHFLYNSLEFIQDMCHGRAPEAEEATIEFARFLRGNLDSLILKTPIPFKKELQHTQNYLSLETNRFKKDKLHILYDLKSVDFRIPSLTLQPLVENAVRHGVMKRESGGTIIISTAESKDAFIVTVTDDGVGFDTSAAADSSRSHIGITNVRNRLETMCSATLAIISSPGEGTSAIIKLPKEPSENENTDRR